jgi:hypothetical protein
MSKRDKMKEDIVDVVRKSGIAIRAGKIETRITLPDNVSLNELLNELVAEGRLIRRVTLLNNGDTDHIYNLRIAS